MLDALEAVRPFLVAGIAGMLGTLVVQPADNVKSRIQLINESRGMHQTTKSTKLLDVASSILREEGWTSFYKGLDSSLFRQSLFSTFRLGIYKWISDTLKKRHEKTGLSPLELVYASACGGTVAALISNPFDLCMVRCQADNLLPVERRRNYRHVFDAIYRVQKEEGIKTLWRGSSPAVIRATVANLSTIATYDVIKDLISRRLENKDTTAVRMAAAALSTVIGTTMILPFDNIKTKLMMMKEGADKKMPYRGTFDCMVKSIQREGPSGLWVGWVPFYFRAGPFITVSYTHLTLPTIYSV
eukprot:TRINITY_DN1719_c0_g1_i9.p1 TRINITY_DN1719_c0_g1~~TRINITY_DN1719_c0_g1_i9.p1  ORF type:complete len:300 (+),score=43.08 TRINITY_DN1719_c0_g1_i9:57-956(+)